VAALRDKYPTSCWQPGQPIVDQVELPLGAGAVAGDWWLSLRAFGITASEGLPRWPWRCRMEPLTHRLAWTFRVNPE